MKIRKATIDDAEAISSIINHVVDEEGLTSLRRFSKDEEETFIQSLKDREAMFVAVDEGRIVGFQGIFMFAQWSESMNHVGNILTMISPECRRRGIGD